MTVLGLIPARGGSKRCARKNARPLPRPDGVPLVVWTIGIADLAETLDRLVVSSDDDEILELAERHGAEPLVRPDDLATDDASPYDVIRHALDSLDQPFEYVCLLQPTSPFRLMADIDLAVTLAVTNQIASVASREQGSDVPNGAVYVGRCDWLRDGGNWDEMHEPTRMPTFRSLDIDTEEDFEMAERHIEAWHRRTEAAG